MKTDRQHRSCRFLVVFWPFFAFIFAEKIQMKKSLWLILLVFLAVASLNAQNDTVIFSVRGGFYEDVFALHLYNINPWNHIRYTTNGNRPTAESLLYMDSLWLDETKYSESDIYTIQISPDDMVFVPDSVQHCIVIRAAVFDENDSCISKVITNSYFIHALGCDTHGLAVVSLCADSLDLFDYEQGIMVPGILYDPLDSLHTGNYYQHGREWERLSHIEFYDCVDNSGINQDCGLRTHGNLSRRYPSKGLKVYARQEYGKKRFKYNFYNEPDLDSYNHLVLKPFALGWPFSGIQDYMCNKLALQLGLPSSNSRPVILYLNGEYWGVYFLQEKMDEDFLEDHFDINPDNCNLIGDWNGHVDCGNNANFIQMMNWFQNADLADDEAYQHACELMDMDNYIDYMVFETFVANWDWPYNNMRCWQEGNGKWRWMFFDGDAALISSTFDVFANAAVYIPPESWDNFPNAKLVFGKLLENEQFKTAFEVRVMELCEGMFHYENTFPLYQSIVETLRPNVGNHAYRFGNPVSVDAWEQANTYTEGFLFHRVETFWENWYDFVGLNEHVGVTACVFPNPFSEEIHLSFDADASGITEIAIYDLMGRKVYIQQGGIAQGRDDITLLPNLGAGVYVLKVGGLIRRIVSY